MFIPNVLKVFLKSTKCVMFVFFFFLFVFFFHHSVLRNFVCYIDEIVNFMNNNKFCNSKFCKIVNFVNSIF